MDPAFDDIFTRPENDFFKVVLFPDRIYHARYLNATRSHRYRYNVREVRNYLDINVMKGEVYLEGKFLSNFLRLEYGSSRLVGKVWEKGRMLREQIVAWVKLLPENESDIAEARVKLHYCPKINAYQVEIWENLEPPGTTCHDFKVLAAKLLASGYVVGWIQGRSEFGPRALGNRSILADPRPDENKGRINKMIKKREGYRPFAPSVLEEDVDEFFEVPPNQKQLPFMIFVVNVRKEKRNLLGAVTHVDGTARVQTVSRKTNEQYWDLIHWFKKLTGVPILLNTSFNNNVEPIVDSVEDAVVCFLTTGLDYLVVGEYLIKKKEVSWQNYLSLKLSLPPHISLHQVKKVCTDSKFDNLFYIGNSYDTKFQVGVSAEVFRVLTLANSEKTVGNLLHENGETEEGKAQGIVKELIRGKQKTPCFQTGDGC